MAQALRLQTVTPTDHPGRESRDRLFTLANHDGEGVRLASLSPMSRLIIRTRNTCYRVVVLAPLPAIIVQGGRYFPEPAETVFRGAIRNDTLIPDWLVVGCRMSLAGETGPIVTSRIQSIEVAIDSLHGPF